MHVSSRPSWLLVVSIVLTGCASVPPPTPAPAPGTDVRYHAVDNKDSKHYVLTPSETAVSPSVGGDNHPPVYPPALVARRLPPVNVRAKLIVDDKGTVTDVRFADANQADADRRIFEQAVRTATLQWTFVPMLIQHWKEMPDGGQKVVQSDPMPFSQDYVFNFALVNGKPVVESGVPPSK